MSINYLYDQTVVYTDEAGVRVESNRSYIRLVVQAVEEPQGWREYEQGNTAVALPLYLDRVTGVVVYDVAAYEKNLGLVPRRKLEDGE